MDFKIIKQSKKSRARAGIIKTGNSQLHTPAFFPVATQGCIKTLSLGDIKQLNLEGILCNTYHLYLRPGVEIIKKFGGLHNFVNFKGIIATDSGGFQIFSLGKGLEQGVGKVVKIFPKEKTTKPVPSKIKKSLILKIREKGVWFRSHLNGETHFFSPEKSIAIQKALGADIIFAFDECTSPFDSFESTKKSMERTHRWAERSLAEFKNKKSKSTNKDQALFGIIQGGEYKELRKTSAKFISSLSFDGFGIGGSLGKTKDRMFEILDWTIPLLPKEKPRHLLGIGHLEDLKKAVQKGIDLFDCVYPTRMARHGVAITSKGLLDLKRSKFLSDKNPLDKNCHCPACQNYSRGFLSHLIRAKEATAMRLLTIHNLYFFKNFMDKIREQIVFGKI